MSKALERLQCLAARSGGETQSKTLAARVQSDLDGKTKRCCECGADLPFAYTRGHHERSRWFCDSECAESWKATAKPYLRCPAEFVDGFSWTILDATASPAASDMVQAYLENDPQDGEEHTFKCVYMSDAEVERLPEL